MLTVKLDSYPACGVNATGDVYRRMGEKVNCPNGAREATLGCMVGSKADEHYRFNRRKFKLQHFDRTLFASILAPKLT